MVQPNRTARLSWSPRRVGLAIALLAGLMPALGCMAQNLSRTVGKGNGELHVSAGGPLFARLGPTVPIPHTHVGGRYGVTDWMDVDGSANLLALPYGVLGLDAAANFQLVRRPQGIAVASSARVYLLGDLDDPPALRWFPELGLHVGGTIPHARWLHLYGGTTAIYAPHPPPNKPLLFVTPFTGVEWLLPNQRSHGARQHGVAFHFAWINPWDTSSSVVDYRPKHGAIALYLGYRLRFGGLDR